MALKGRVTEMTATKEKTYWNGEPALCRRVRVVVGKSPRTSWWCAELAGQERNAVEVCYAGRKFYLDDDAYTAPEGTFGPVGHGAGGAWWKVTIGQGGPDCYHASLPVEKVVREIAQ